MCKEITEASDEERVEGGSKVRNSNASIIFLTKYFYWEIANRRRVEQHYYRRGELQSDDSGASPIEESPGGMPEGWKAYGQDVVGREQDNGIVVVLGQEGEDGRGGGGGVYETTGGGGGGIEYDEQYPEYVDGGEEEEGGEEEGEGEDYGTYYDYDYGGEEEEEEPGEEDYVDEHQDDYEEEKEEEGSEEENPVEGEASEGVPDNPTPSPEEEEEDNEQEQSSGEEDETEYVEYEEEDGDGDAANGGEEYDEERDRQEEYDDEEEEDYGEEGEEEEEEEEDSDEYDAEELLYRNYEILSDFYKKHFVDLRVLDTTCDPEEVPPPEVEHGAVKEYRSEFEMINLYL